MCVWKKIEIKHERSHLQIICCFQACENEIELDIKALMGCICLQDNSVCLGSRGMIVSKIQTGVHVTHSCLLCIWSTGKERMTTQSFWLLQSHWYAQEQVFVHISEQGPHALWTEYVFDICAHLCTWTQLLYKIKGHGHSRLQRPCKRLFLLSNS